MNKYFSLNLCDRRDFEGLFTCCKIDTKLRYFFIAPAYSRVRYRSSNFRPSVRSFVRSFVRSSVRSSVNIYVEV